MLKPQYNDHRYNDIPDITGIKSKIKKKKNRKKSWSYQNVFQQKVLIIQKQSKDIQNSKASLAKYRSNKRPISSEIERVLYPG